MELMEEKIMSLDAWAGDAASRGDRDTRWWTIEHMQEEIQGLKEAEGSGSRPRADADTQSDQEDLRQQIRAHALGLRRRTLSLRSLLGEALDGVRCGPRLDRPSDEGGGMCVRAHERTRANACAPIRARSNACTHTHTNTRACLTQI